MTILAQISGVLAVIIFLLSFQFKTRKNIITVNVISRVLYISQYILLGAVEGAALDFTGAISSVFAKYKNKPVVNAYKKLILVATNLLLIVIGVLLYKNIFSLFAIFGIVLEITALWITKEKSIRLLSLASAPFWLIYNFANKAYGSVLGNILVMISIVIAIIRYDIKNNGEN